MQKRKFCKIGTVLLSGLCSHSVIAGTMGESPTYSYVASISAGAAWEQGGETWTFYLTPQIIKTYVPNKSSSALADAEIFLGIQKILSTFFQGQLGIAISATSNASLDGHIWDDADPAFNNYIYRYKVQHTHVALKGKLLADNGYFVIPWISGSVGAGFNHAHQFTNTPTIPEAEVNENYPSRTQAAFTYTVGAGIQRAINENWQVGLGYEFADWGNSMFHRAASQTL